MPDSLRIALKNDSETENVYVYITGIAIQHNGQRCFIKANAKDLYFPQDVSAIGTQLAEDCAIPLGKPGETKHVTIPQIAGGRLWITMNSKLTFLLNPGPALVEPSVLNPSDPNAGVNFGFVEFTLNDAQLYANISYVDFVPRVPIAISLQQASGQVQRVAGMAPDGLDRLAESMKRQAQQDGKPWDKLIIRHDNKNLRVLNATHGGAVGGSFDGYFEPYVEEVWQKYASGAQMKINTQAGPGVLNGSVKGNELDIGGEKFQKPNTADILGCNSGPFTTGSSPVRNAIIPRLAAAFVRSTLHEVERHPSQPETFYNHPITNHYARLVHEHNLDRKGYAFAYDDVQPDEGEDQSGKVNAGDPELFTISIGGRTPPGNKPSFQGQQSAPQQQYHQQQQQQQQRPMHNDASNGQQGQQKGKHGISSKIHDLKQKFLH